MENVDKLKICRKWENDWKYGENFSKNRWMDYVKIESKLIINCRYCGGSWRSNSDKGRKRRIDKKKIVRRRNGDYRRSFIRGINNIGRKFEKKILKNENNVVEKRNRGNFID